MVFGAIKGLFGGGKKSSGYKSKYTGEYEKNYRTGIYNRLGADISGYDKKGNPTYDFSNVGRQITPDQATDSYSFDPVHDAVQGFYNPAEFSAKYTPKSFTFGNGENIDEEMNTQYGIGEREVRRQNAGALERNKELIGTRRPGLLLKAAETNERDVSQNLAGLNSRLKAEALRQKTDLQKAQQLAEADEGFRGYQSEADLEGRQADEIFRYLSGLGDMGGKLIGLEDAVTDSERDYQDRGLEYLSELLKTMIGSQNQAAGLNNQRSGNALSSLATIGSAAAKFI